MMKIRYALLLSVSCLGLGSLAHAGLIPDITPVGKNTSIFTLRGAPAGESLLRVSRSSYTHLASQSKLLSTSVIARRTSSDAAIHNNINGSPRRINSPRDDDSDDLFILTAAQGARSAFHAPINQQQNDRVKLRQLASVCFITDAGNCLITAGRIRRIILPVGHRAVAAHPVAVAGVPAAIMETVMTPNGNWIIRSGATKRDM